MTNVEAVASFVCRKEVPEEISKWLEFSQYIVDPNWFRFKKVIRVVALVMLFIKNLKRIISTNHTEDHSQKWRAKAWGFGHKFSKSS